MHDTAYAIGGQFLKTYLPAAPCTVVEIGSFAIPSHLLKPYLKPGDIGALSDFCGPDVSFIGLDVEPGPGVDLVIDPTKPLPLESESADLVLSTSQMEHDPCFWETFLELARIVRPGGLIYFNSPSNGRVHRYPNDYWRFYPDAGLALAAWARRKEFPIQLIESFIAERENDIWNDFIAVFQKEPISARPNVNPLSDHVRCTNVRLIGTSRIFRARNEVEDAVIAEGLQSHLIEHTGKRVTIRPPPVPVVAPLSSDDVARATADLITTATRLRSALADLRASRRESIGEISTNAENAELSVSVSRHSKSVV